MAALEMMSIVKAVTTFGMKPYKIISRVSIINDYLNDPFEWEYFQG